MFWGVTRTLEGPPYLTHGWDRTISAERRWRASFTRSLEMRSLASPEMSLHSVWGKSKWPSWMEWNRSSWQALQGSPWFQPHSIPEIYKKRKIKSSVFASFYKKVNIASVSCHCASFIFNKFEPICSILNQFDLIWTKLIQLDWTSFVNFGQV